MKYLLGVIGVIVVAVLAIVIIVSRAPSTDQPVEKDGKKVLTLTDLAKENAKVSHTLQGRLVGEDQHRAIRITVDRNERRIEILQGYNGNIERSQVFGNTQSGYDTFIKAIENAGFARARKYNPDDERGICPTGNRFIYEVNKDGHQESRLWSTSCAVSQGTMAGNATLIRQLFQQQITDYEKFINTVRL